MAGTKFITETSYVKLLKDIRSILNEGKTRAAQAAGRELLVTYWHIGKRILDDGILEQSGYGESVLEDLSDELSVDLSTLKRCVYFVQTYPQPPKDTPLTWSHYRALITVRDNQERKWYTALTKDEKLNYRQLEKAIKEDRFEQYAKSKNKKRQPKQKIKRPSEPAYLYTAKVERVVDGDTLLLMFDLGFQVWKQQRIRLAEIDCPALDTPKGREAYRFVRAHLLKTPFVMVKTNKIDVYGRYIGHVFYSLKKLSKDDVFLKGNYLNSELVENGLAKVI